MNKIMKVFNDLNYKNKIVLFALAWVIVWSIITMFFADEINSWDYVYLYVLVSVIPLLMPSLVLSYLIDGVNRFSVKKILGSFLFLTGFDLIIPPLFLNLNGEINTSVLFSKGSVDFFIYKLWLSFIPSLQGLLLFLLVYPVSFLLLVLLALWLLSPKDLKSLTKI